MVSLNQEWATKIRTEYSRIIKGDLNDFEIEESTKITAKPSEKKTGHVEVTILDERNRKTFKFHVDPESESDLKGTKSYTGGSLIGIVSLKRK